jgi:crotonobetainyl-CoA:carnitine CoA-transferase CaiB-like acyl-CoA transferase
VAGAISPVEVSQMLRNLGFEAIRITRKERSEEIIKSWNVVQGAEQLVFSAYIEAKKPLDAKHA